MGRASAGVLRGRRFGRGGIEVLPSWRRVGRAGPFKFVGQVVGPTGDFVACCDLWDRFGVGATLARGGQVIPRPVAERLRHE
jgi:hypothetical protein